VPTEKELLERIRQLEQLNSALQDKLDEIWAILAPVYEPDEDIEDLDDRETLVQIDLPGKRPKA
jgi:prefoldin subunit 5